MKNELLKIYLTVPESKICVAIRDLICKKIKETLKIIPEMRIEWNTSYYIPLIKFGWIKLTADDDTITFIIKNGACVCTTDYDDKYSFVILLIEEIFKETKWLEKYIYSSPVCLKKDEIHRIIQICRRNHYTESAYLDSVLFSEREYTIILPFDENQEEDNLPECELLNSNKRFGLSVIKDNYPIQYMILKGIK